MINRSLAQLVLFMAAFPQLQAATLTLTAPLDYQVIQRENREGGTIAIEGFLAGAKTEDAIFEARIVAGSKDWTNNWFLIPYSIPLP